jgi:hypothetical protein
MGLLFLPSSHFPPTVFPPVQRMYLRTKPHKTAWCSAQRKRGELGGAESPPSPQIAGNRPEMARGAIMRGCPPQGALSRNHVQWPSLAVSVYRQLTNLPCAPPGRFAQAMAASFLDEFLRRDIGEVSRRNGQRSRQAPHGMARIRMELHANIRNAAPASRMTAPATSMRFTTAPPIPGNAPSRRISSQGRRPACPIAGACPGGPCRKHIGSRLLSADVPMAAAE